MSRINGVTGIIVLISLITAALVASGPAGMAFGLLLALLFTLFTKAGFGKAVMPVLRLWPFFLFIFVLNTVFGDGEADIWEWWIFTVSTDGIRTGLSVISRCIAVSVIAGAYISVSSPIEMTGSLSWLLKPFGYIGLPVERLSFIMSMSLFFVPDLKSETDRIVRAQRARGAVWGGDGLIDRAKSYIPLIVPLFMAGLRRADEMSRAMVSRGYDGEHGARIGKPEFGFWDIAASAVSISLIFIAKRSFL